MKFSTRFLTGIPLDIKKWASKNRNYQPELSVYDNFNIRAEYFNDAGQTSKPEMKKDRKNIFLKFIPFRFEIVNSCVWE